MNPVVQSSAAIINPDLEMRIQGKHCLRYLGAAEYADWDALVDASPQGTVLCRSWLLSALEGDVRVLGLFQGSRLIAGIPLYFERRLGFTICRMPKLIHTWGVILEPFKGKYTTVLSRQMEVLKLFAAALRNQRFFVQSFHPSLPNWLPFYWQGFEQRSRFGYVFEDLADLDHIWQNMDSDRRRNVCRAEGSGIRVVPCDSDMVASATEKTFRNQQLRLRFTAAYLKAIYSAAKQHNAGECFAAIDSLGNVHAARLLLWDFKRVYAVVGGTDPRLRSSGAESLLLWTLIKLSSVHSASFDFAGSMLQPVEAFVRTLGAKLVSYNQIVRIPRPMRLFVP